MKKLLLFVLCFILLSSTISCSKGSAKEPEKADIRGSITKITIKDDKKTGIILVEGKLESDTSYDKASITITGATKIVKADDNKKLSINDLKQDMKVEAIFTGPVRESYPVQADAKLIRILD